MSRRRILAAVLVAVSAVGALVAGQVVTIYKTAVLDYQGYSNSPGNPSSGIGRLYYNTGTQKLTCLNSDGSSCNPTSGGGGTITGSGVANQVAFWTATTVLGGNTNFTFDPTNGSFNATGVGGFSSINQGASGLNQVAISNSAITLSANESGATGNFSSDGPFGIGSNTGDITIRAIAGLIRLSLNASMTDAGALSAKQVQAIGTTQTDAFVTGATNANGLSVAPSSISIAARETGSTLTLAADAGLFLTVASANRFNFPTATGAANAVLSTDGGNPQVGSWVAVGTLIGFPDRAVAGTTDTILTTDRGGRVVYTNVGAVAVTLPQAGSAGFTNNFYYDAANEGLAGVVTITPTTSTINGAATLVLQTGQSCRIGPNSTGTNYAADCSESQATATSPITLTRAIHGLTMACATCVVASAPGVGIAHFAGSTQTVTSSAVNLASADVTGLLPVANGGTNLASGTSGGIPAYTGTTTIASSALLAANSLVLGGGAGVVPKTVAGIGSDGISALNLGVAGTAAGKINLSGATSGITGITAAPIAGTPSSEMIISNAISIADHVSTVSIRFNNGANAEIASTATTTLNIYSQGFLTLGRLDFGNDTTATPALCTNGTGLTLGQAGANCTTLTNFTSALNTSNTYATGTNCTAVGTAASPSVASCTAASAGAFSCATNASTATCTVNTTAVATNSEVEILQTASAGTRLGVTCNTTADVPTGPRLASISNGVSFTINLGTVVTNPTCYFYRIVN